MDWHDVAEKVAAAAPALGAALGGPGGAAVGGLVASVLGVEATPAAVQEAVDHDPQAALKLRRIEADLERALVRTRGEALVAELKGESALQRNWRPLVMLWFAALVGAHWLGWTPANLAPEVVADLLGIVKVGLGGYVIGRSAEKITRHATGSGLYARLAGRR